MHPFWKSSPFVSSVHRIFSQTRDNLGDNQDIFWQMWDEALCYFWSAVAFVLELSHGCCFCPVSFLIVESWTLTLIEASEACSSLDVILGSFMTSWMSYRCALGVILVDRPLLVSFTTVTIFLHLLIMALTVVRWSPKALEMALQPFPDWYMSTMFFLICSWISLDRVMMCCSLSKLHFVREVILKWFLDSTCLAVIRPWSV